jgi:hypothetical protein
MKTITVKWSGRYRDGGTDVYTEVDTGTKYFVDNRIRSETKGKIFDRYPGDKGAKQLTDLQFVTAEKHKVLITNPCIQ